MKPIETNLVANIAAILDEIEEKAGTTCNEFRNEIREFRKIFEESRNNRALAPTHHCETLWLQTMMMKAKLEGMHARRESKKRETCPYLALLDQYEPTESILATQWQIGWRFADFSLKSDAAERRSKFEQLRPGIRANPQFLIELSQLRSQWPGIDESLQLNLRFLGEKDTLTEIDLCRKPYLWEGISIENGPKYVLEFDLVFEDIVLTGIRVAFSK